MFGLDRAWWMIPFVLIIVLIIWGPGKMPEVGAGLGHAIREFRGAMSGLRSSVVDATVASDQGMGQPGPGGAAPTASAAPTTTAPSERDGTPAKV
jgi:TatA/E family protein of Tat protein translocase